MAATRAAMTERTKSPKIQTDPLPGRQRAGARGQAVLRRLNPTKPASAEPKIASVPGSGFGVGGSIENSPKPSPPTTALAPIVAPVADSSVNVTSLPSWRGVEPSPPEKVSSMNAPGVSEPFGDLKFAPLPPNAEVSC